MSSGFLVELLPDRLRPPVSVVTVTLVRGAE
jgi:hypothetical protein